MTNKFAITITAVDAASKTINKVNANVNKLFRPYDNAKKSVKSFSEAFGRNDLVKRPLWALSTVGKGLTTFGSAFGMAESSVLGGSTRIASALGMMGGPVGAFLATATTIIGGTAGIGVAMAKTGQDINRTAKNLNLSTTELQEYRGAAKLAGLETQTMDQGLQSLGTTLQEADFGRNPQAAEALRRMGVTISRNADGSVATVKAFRDIADVVSHMSDQNMARKLTDMFGITELLPLLREASSGIDGYIKKAHELGYVQGKEQVQANNEAAKSWNTITTAIDGAGVSLGNLIAKQSHLSDFANWVSNLAGKVKDWADGKSPKPEGSWSAPGGATGSWDGGAGAGRGAGPTATKSQIVSDANKKWGLPNGLLDSVWSAESDRGTNMVSKKGALGHFQFMPATAKQYGLQNPYDLGQSSEAAGHMYHDLLEKYHGNLPKALAAYNWGPRNVDEQGVQNAPAQTQEYIRRVLEQLPQAIASAMQNAPLKVEVHNAPAGMTIKPQRGLGQANVGLTMAPGGAS